MLTRRGMALPLALVALVVIGGLVAGSFFLATQDLVAGRTVLGIEQALADAENTAMSRLLAWGAAENELEVGDSLVIPGEDGHPAGSVRRLDHRVFLIRAVGTDVAGRARRHVVLLAALEGIPVPIVRGVEQELAGSDPDWFLPLERVPAPAVGPGPLVWVDRGAPIVRAPGDLTVAGGSGRGVLLVDGDLRLGGGFTWSGVIAVRGRVLGVAPGGRVVGAVVAGGVVTGAVAVEYSPEIAGDALRLAAPAQPLSERGWMQPP